MTIAIEHKNFWRLGMADDLFPPYGLINYTDTKAKFRHLKFTCKGTLRQVFICLRTPPLLWTPLHIVYVDTVKCILIHTGKGEGGEKRTNQREG